MNPNIFYERTFFMPRKDAIHSLATRKPNVLSETEYWLSMPGWGGVIATTFDWPVIYFAPGMCDQTIFPFVTPPNQNPPIVLVWANYHFASLLLDFTLPNLPAPNICITWQQFCTLDSSRWPDSWKPLVDTYTEKVKANSKISQRKKAKVIVHLD